MLRGTLLAVLALSPGLAQASPDLRVLVFPHILKYVAPQGRETRFTEVSLRSAGTCVAKNRYGQTVQAGPLLSFTWQGVTEPLNVDCTEPATVIRETGLTAYSYPGSFVIQRGRGTSLPDHLQVINWVTLETYLKGVLPGEIPQSWPLETLKAQAVAARTYAMWELRKARRDRPIGSPLDTGYDFDDTVQYQVYIGSTQTPLPPTIQALTETRGQVLTAEAGAPIRAYFHADSGGHTEDAAHAIPDSSAPYCVGKPEVYDTSSAPAPWVKRIPLADAAAKLKGAGLLAPDLSLESAQVNEITRTPSGRARHVVLYVIGRTNETLAPPSVSALDFRFALGLKSTLFGVRLENNELVFEGRGAGHGAGMSQWGAKLLADQLHWDYEKILMFYYTGVRLEGRP